VAQPLHWPDVKVEFGDGPKASRSAWWSRLAVARKDRAATGQSGAGGASSGELRTAIITIDGRRREAQYRPGTSDKKVIEQIVIERDYDLRASTRHGEISDFLDRQRRRGLRPLIVDAGANIGYFSCLMARLAGPSGIVLAIEPEPRNLELLERNLLSNRLENVKVHSCALGASEGSAKLGLYKPANRGRHSMVDAKARPTIEVRVRTLDSLVKSAANNNAGWSLVKIDVEGYEGFVVQGARETLPLVQTLVMEFSPELLKKSGVDPAAVLQMLCAQFKMIYRIENSELIPASVSDCLAGDNQLELVFERS